MPPEMAISMRHTKLKAQEAALLAGELSKPSWESRNEGIHERVSFEDTIWGFDLAGGAYYKTPLRVTFVKADSRAQKAGIRPGDKLLRINDIDTSELTIQEAHQMIVESGIHIRLRVTAPEDEEDAYFCYEDPIEEEYFREPERIEEEVKVEKRPVQARVSHYWSLQWPWVSKRRIIYRESNCFMVPSKYEDKHRDKFSPQPIIRYQDDIVLENIQSKNSSRMTRAEYIEQLKKKGITLNSDEITEEMLNDINKLSNGDVNGVENEENGDNEVSNKSPVVEENNEDTNTTENTQKQITNGDANGVDIEEMDSENQEVNENEGDTGNTDEEILKEAEETNSKANDDDDAVSEMSPDEDEVIDEVLKQNKDSISTNDEDKILDGILNDADGQPNKLDSIER